jgi:hypothetical protein
MTKKNNLEKFVNNHGIKILDDNKRACRYRKVNMDFFKYQNDYNIINSNVEYETEKLYTLEISESELQKISDFESEVFNHMNQKGHYNMFETLMDQKQQEKYLREKYPAVKKAYENYSLILKMANEGQF